MGTTELDRSMLDGKDREELHAIAGAVGVKAPTRMRKADLITAILEAASGNGDTTAAAPVASAPAKTRTVRSARASEVDAVCGRTCGRGSCHRGVELRDRPGAGDRAAPVPGPHRVGTGARGRNRARN